MAAPHVQRVVIPRLCAGPRIGPSELFRLEWRDVDLATAMLRMPGAQKNHLEKGAGHISKNAPDKFAQYLALGITCLIVFQALINLSVATGMFPAKGLPLPFISFGGTSLVINMAAAGILINLSRYKSVPK